MSPQALKNNIYSFKSDIWSLGVVYYEMLYGVTPWQANTERELGDKISSVPVQFPSNVQVSKESKDFILQCLNIDESKRIAPEQLELHPLTRPYFSQKTQAPNMAVPSTPLNQGKENFNVQKTPTHQQVNKAVPSMAPPNQNIAYQENSLTAQQQQMRLAQGKKAAEDTNKNSFVLKDSLPTPMPIQQRPLAEVPYLFRSVLSRRLPL